jgi:hypothetical protein
LDQIYYRVIEIASIYADKCALRTHRISQCYNKPQETLVGRKKADKILE